MPVVDASIALAFIFPDEDGQTFESLRKEFPNSLVAPTLFDLELLSAILVGFRRDRFTAAESMELQQDASLLPIRRIDPDAPTLAAILPLAERRNLSVYDALYLSLAQTLDLPLATHDRRLRAAAEAEGLSVLP